MSLQSILPYKYLNLLSYLLLCEVIEGDNDKNNNMRKMIILTVKTTMSNVMKLPPVQWYKQRYQDPWDKYTNWYRDPWAKFVSNGVMLFFGIPTGTEIPGPSSFLMVRVHWGTKIPGISIPTGTEIPGPSSFLMVRVHWGTKIPGISIPTGTEIPGPSSFLMVEVPRSQRMFYLSYNHS